MTPDDALYAYAVVAGDAAPPDAAAAIFPGVGVQLVRAGGCAAVVSAVPRHLFANGPEGRLDDPDWIAERAQAHHAVVAACAMVGPALPLAFGALFSDAAPLEAWLVRHDETLRHALRQVAGCAEWSLRVEEDAPAHEGWLDAHDSGLRDLSVRLATAAPGTAYLLGQRRVQLRAAARAARLRDLSARLGRRLDAHARAMPADMTWLVAADRAPAMRAEIARVAKELDGSGLSVSLAGPWPAYASARAALSDG